MCLFGGVFCCSGCACGDVLLESVQGLSVGPACCRALWGALCAQGNGGGGRGTAAFSAEPSIIPGAADMTLIINLPVPSAWLCWPPHVHSLCYPSPSQGHRQLWQEPVTPAPRLPSAPVGIPWHRWGWHVSIDCSRHWLGHRLHCPLPPPAMLLFFASLGANAKRRAGDCGSDGGRWGWPWRANLIIPPPP